MLERHAGETQDRAVRVERHVRGLRSRGLLGGATSHGAVRRPDHLETATLPLTVGQKAVAGVMHAEGRSTSSNC
jgi:hypothetical protein